MVPLPLERRTEETTESVPANGTFGLINYLRFIAMECRAKPRADLFEACALLQVTRSQSQQAYAEALMRCLNEALGKRARLHAPGTPELSFDEAWLAQLAASAERKDHSSVSFLLASRIDRKDRRLFRFLVGRVSEFFALN